MKRQILTSLIFLCLGISVNAQWQTSTNNIYYNQGNVGIGQMDLSYKFSVGDNGHIFSIKPHPAGVDLYSTGNFAPHYQTDFSIYKGIPGSGELKFKIDGNGNVGIGIVTVGYQTMLHVKESGSSSGTWRGRIVASGDNNAVVMGEVNGKAWLGAHNASLNAWSDLIMQTGGGNIGIGTASPAYKLDVNGTFRVTSNSELFGGSNKIYGNNDPNNYYLGHYVVYGSDGLDIHWHGGVRLGDYTGNVMQISNGQIGIGTSTPAYKLDVIGTIRAREIKVDLTGADFVFEKNYKLMPLTELEQFVKEQKHLPEVASAKEMEKNGTDLGNLNTKLLQKVEELTLYTIDQQKQIDELKRQIQELKHK
ncbi:MAG: hypothetical protein Q8928_10310 [Bacteroidota bacterium]|nr:hypothetical protein [Bacteroidota bacterium]